MAYWSEGCLGRATVAPQPVVGRQPQDFGVPWCVPVLARRVLVDVEAVGDRLERTVALCRALLTHPL